MAIKLIFHIYIHDLNIGNIFETMLMDLCNIEFILFAFTIIINVFVFLIVILPMVSDILSFGNDADICILCI